MVKWVLGYRRSRPGKRECRQKTLSLLQKFIPAEWNWGSSCRPMRLVGDDDRQSVRQRHGLVRLVQLVFPQRYRVGMGVHCGLTHRCVESSPRNVPIQQHAFCFQVQSHVARDVQALLKVHHPLTPCTRCDNSLRWVLGAELELLYAMLIVMALDEGREVLVNDPKIVNLHADNLHDVVVRHRLTFQDISDVAHKAELARISHAANVRAISRDRNFALVSDSLRREHQKSLVARLGLSQVQQKHCDDGTRPAFTGQTVDSHDVLGILREVL